VRRGSRIAELMQRLTRPPKQNVPGGVALRAAVPYLALWTAASGCKSLSSVRSAAA